MKDKCRWRVDCKGVEHIFGGAYFPRAFYYKKEALSRLRAAKDQGATECALTDKKTGKVISF